MANLVAAVSAYAVASPQKPQKLKPLQLFRGATGCSALVKSGRAFWRMSRCACQPRGRGHLWGVWGCSRL